MDKENFKNQTFIQALKNTINGIIYTYKTSRNLKVETIIGVCAIILAIVLKLSKTEWPILVITMFLVLMAEMINSAIEETVDLITEEYNDKAKNAKDIAGGAVTLTSLMSIIIGIILFLDKLIVFIFDK
jgi:diacylglycerol kinase (ATP)